MIFVMKLTLLQTTHILQYLTDIYQNIHKNYKFWHVSRDGPATGPKNFPVLLSLVSLNMKPKGQHTDNNSPKKRLLPFVQHTMTLILYKNGWDLVLIQR